MAKTHISTPTILISSAVFVFLLIIGMVFYVTYQFGQKAKVGESQQMIEVSRGGGDEAQQVRRIRFTKQSNGESMEIYMDGTIKYFDINGKLIKTGRRGFAETQNIFRKFEWLINSKQTIEGGDYRIEIETEEGTIIVDPGGSGGGGDEIDDAIDFIDQTINPTPTPRPSPTGSPIPTATITPSPEINPSPTPSDIPMIPFKCEDYYTSGKPIQISNILCGPTPTP